MTPLLEVDDLKTYFKTDDGIVKAVDGVSFKVGEGKTLGIVGESGSGKSVTCLTIMGLNPKKSASSEGRALFRGEDLLQASNSRLREIRGNDIAMIFQDPMTSLNPVHKIGGQIVEGILLHKDVSRKEARNRALEALKEVGIPRAERRIDDYPHQFSGGMRQRVMIAMALVNEPSLLIADEPTTALMSRRRRRSSSYAQAAGRLRHRDHHDHPRPRSRCRDRGRGRRHVRGPCREKAPVNELFEHPLHPYTWGLLGSLPRLESDIDRLVQIPGTPPSLLSPPRGCRFNPRCPYVFDRCKKGCRSSSRRRTIPIICKRATSTTRPRRARPSGRSPPSRERHSREMADELLKIEHLTKHFPVTRGIVFQKQVAAVKAVEDVSFTLNRGETLGVVGESGCGKSTMARCIMRLLDPTSGAITFEGRDIRRSRGPTCVRSGGR